MTGNAVRIIAAVLDTHQLILYKEDGSTVSIPQGDLRIRGILDSATSILSAGGVATVSLDQPPTAADPTYADFEKKTNGLVRFFRVAKKAVQHLLGSDEERQEAQAAAEILEPQVLGKVPGNKITNAVDDIMANAVPASSGSFRPPGKNSEDTMIAVVETQGKTKVITGVEGLHGQISHANRLGSTKGVEALIRRLGEVSEKRGHSVQDVIRFLERGDLPVADDGSIIAYKILRKSDKEGVYVDCHTRKVQQKVGSYVCVAEELVDRNRRNECSNGLHIARRGYLGSFPGDVCVLVKIAPEDVVTVPHGDPNKVRVCGYHILSLIPDGDFKTLKSNRPMTENAVAQRLLGQAISGNHIARLEEVRITEPKGGGVVITQIAKQAAPSLQTAPKAVALEDHKEVEEKLDPVDPKAVSQKVTEAKAKPLSVRQQVATQLFKAMNNSQLTTENRQNAARELLAHKKRCKVGWGGLGLDNDVAETIKAVLALDPAPVPIKIDLKTPDPKIGKDTGAKPMNRQQRAAYEAGLVMNGRAPHVRTNAAKNLLFIKKASKVSWDVLNVPQHVVEEAHALVELDSKGAKTPVPGNPISIKADELTKDQVKAISSAKVAKPAAKPAPVAEPAPTLNRVEKAKFYWDKMNDKANMLWLRQEFARQLLAHKKSSKLGWKALGLPEDAGKVIEKII